MIECLAEWKDEIWAIIPNKAVFLFHLFLGYYVYLNVKTKSWYQYGRHYQAPLSPYREIHIDPESVIKKSKGIEINTKNEIYTHVLGGNWDREFYYFDEFCPAPSIYQHYNENRSWENTILYKKSVEKLSSDRTKKSGFDTHTKPLNAYIRNVNEVDEVDEICKGIDELYYSIKEHGFNSCKEHPRSGSLLRWFRRDNIQINIGRDGEIIHKDGKHRLAICKVIGIEKIPVMVVVRHRRWQKIRDEIHTANKKSNLSEKAMNHLYHPDIEYLHNW